MSTSDIPGNSEATLRDLVEVRPHPTVVRLDHLDEEGSSWITSAYHLTRDVRAHLQSMRRVLSKATGCGMFLIGQYGSGKSHFLAYVTQRLKGTSPGDGREDSAFLAGLSVDVLPISLLNYRAEVGLEDVVSAALGITARVEDRRQQWAGIAERYPGGLLLVLDELSEFLRSKPGRPAFNEDVRFLQFLAEWAQGRRFWVLAAVQEQIEHTGDLEYGMYRKIKDRFPLRFLLSPAHVVDLLSDCILVKKKGYESAVRKLAGQLREAFPSFPLDPDVFCDIYPIHPATLEFLEEVRDRFSQARGVVDFAVTQLAGSDARGIAPFLERPWGSLLSPDSIIDHFQDLFEIQPEFLPLAQQLLPYYRKHLGEIFDTDKLSALAWRILKLLMLTHISPARPGLTAEEAAHWLLYRAARIDPRKNVTIIERVLEQLAQKGRYVAVEEGRYALNLADDGGLALERFLQREEAELRERGAVVPEMLASLLSEDDFHPFVLPRERWQQRKVRWQFHERPYSVYLGDDDAPPREGTAICLRLPWGQGGASPGTYTLAPSRLEPGEAEIELAALARARERSWTPELTKRLEARFQERLNFFRAQVKSAYHEPTVTNPVGEPETAPRVDRSLRFDAWLDAIAEWVLRRTYPSFERFAPSHGPLPKEAYRSLMRFVSERDLGDYDAHEAVKLIREAYLVPMRLLERKGRDYALPKNPERSELVQLVLPMLEYDTAPRVIYEYLESSVYGLVPDQVSLLLIYLLILGEIDILKGKTSYRDAFETLPNPLQYDRIVPGCALRLEQIHDLAKLCEGLGLRVPKQWTVLTQRRVARKLREVAREHRERLQALRLKLRESNQGEKLAERLGRFNGQLASLDRGEDELQGLQQFFFEIGSVSRFLSTLSELQGLPGRIDRLLEQLQRYRHLFAHPVLAKWDDPQLALRIEALGPPPDLEQPDALESWLKRTGEVYAEYREAYRRSHEAWWEARATHPIWSWQLPKISRSRHLGLEPQLRSLGECRARAADLRCRRLVNLDFQPACTCGFDGESSPLEEELRRFESLREEIEGAMARFFGQGEVLTRLRRWVDEGLEVNPRTLAYLKGSEAFPEVNDLELFDRYMAGVELVKELDAGELLGLLGERTWDRAALLDAFERFLERFGEARLRFSAASPRSFPGVAAWCLEQSLRYGVRMPGGLSSEGLREAGEVLRPEWIGPPSLARLEELGLSEETQDRIVGWLLDGRIRAPSREAASPLVTAALELLHPSEPATAEELARLSVELYREHSRFMRIDREAWLERIDRLARGSPEIRARELTSVLEDHRNAQWLILDGLGLPLLEVVESQLGELFPSWRLEALDVALSSEESTTDECYRRLVEAGFNRPIEKINCIDSLLHERFVPFDDLRKLARAELSIAVRQIRERLDPGLPLLVFADHGFRIARDGRSFQHGGSSLLERLAPVLFLVPN